MQSSDRDYDRALRSILRGWQEIHSDKLDYIIQYGIDDPNSPITTKQSSVILRILNRHIPLNY